jgi:hypothetical protein
MVSLLLITGVALAMVMASGMESYLNGNYRSSSSAYYAALAGLEEGRGRLLPSNPNTIAGVAGTGIPALNVILPVNQVTYILNPNTAAGESAATLMTSYPDAEYNSEFGSATAIKTYVNSVSGTNASNIPGPLYKWVRINAVTEKAISADVDGDGNANDNTIPLYYDSGPTPATLVVNAAPPATANQVYEITALAVLPNGSEKLLQYLVAPQSYNMNFPSALTLAGSIGNFQGANSMPYKINGNDGSGNPGTVPGCTNNAPAVPAIGVGPGNTSAPPPNNTLTNQQYVTNNLPRSGNYIGPNNVTSSVVTASPTGALSSASSLNQLVTSIRNNADAVIPNPPNAPNVNNSGTTYHFGGTGWPTNMSASNPQTVYVDGSFDLGPNTGYGLLVVTGNFSYSGNSGWNGVILVIGDGTTTFLGNGGGSGQFNGAIFVATTRDGSGNQLSNLGSVNFDISGGGGNGIYYNSCWIRNVQQPPTYKVLSFKEVPYTAPGT